MTLKNKLDILSRLGLLTSKVGRTIEPTVKMKEFTNGKHWNPGISEHAAVVNSISILDIPNFSPWVSQSEQVSRF